MGKGKYTKEERWEIGRQLYHDEISRRDAVIKYGLNVYTVRDYMRHYRDVNELPPKVQSASPIPRNGGRRPKAERKNVLPKKDDSKNVSNNENN